MRPAKSKGNGTMSLPENDQPVTRSHFDESLKTFRDEIRNEISTLADRLERAENTLLAALQSYA